MYKSFVRGGALLGEADQQKLRKLNEELSLLSLQFGDNILAETNNYQLVVEDKAELKGMPENFLKCRC